jgi:hypothetical protein
MQSRIDSEFQRMQKEALRTREDFATTAEYAQHVYRFAEDFVRAIMADSDVDKAFDISVNVEKVLEHHSISNAIFALAAILESLSKTFEEYSNSTIIFAGFMKIVNDIHKCRFAKEASHGN